MPLNPNKQTIDYPTSVSLRHGLQQDGVVVVKENLATGDEPEYDPTDSSVTRPRALLENIFLRAGLKISSSRRQNGMPRGLYEVRMYVLRPAEEKGS